MGKIKVLIVDDHTIMRDGIRALFTLNDNIDIVGEACNGKEAVQKAQELAPDVIVMDIVMPGIDGLEATREIRKQKSQIKILILTQYNTKEYIMAAFQAGASGYLPKRASGRDLYQRYESFIAVKGSYIHLRPLHYLMISRIMTKITVNMFAEGYSRSESCEIVFLRI
jgi:DNA-binding NarL/FixJ family response regulator